ncbi:hypothetical protein J3458_020546 [Metarhizium acridum]|uniref:uncharacterized protein n=1 Tax=Metarhizium acridum TaxID=92637 RepID=UPI001C6CD570|nr:hypothetical protein J3458_020546 [Metarhizium acridum]
MLRSLTSNDVAKPIKIVVLGAHIMEGSNWLDSLRPIISGPLRQFVLRQVRIQGSEALKFLPLSITILHLLSLLRGTSTSEILVSYLLMVVGFTPCCQLLEVQSANSISVQEGFLAIIF